MIRIIAAAITFILIFFVIIYGSFMVAGWIAAFIEPDNERAREYLTALIVVGAFFIYRVIFPYKNDEE